MDLSTLIQAVVQLGFSVVMCGALAWYIKYMTDKYDAQLDKINTNHQKEIKSITEAVNNNTLVIQRLIDKLDKED